MNENYVRLIAALLDFSKALLRPAVLVGVLFHFRSEIARLLCSLASVKTAGSEWVFQRVEQLQAEPQKTNLVVGDLSKNPSDPKALEGAKSLMRPGGLVIAWARDHGAENAWDLGPKNWERCLFPSPQAESLRSVAGLAVVKQL